MLTNDDIEQIVGRGLLIGTANEKRKVVPYAVGLVLIHALAVVGSGGSVFRIKLGAAKVE